MFKKTLLAAALVAATGTATAGTITVSGTAYKVGNEYLASYTGSALTGDLEVAGNYIAYQAGIALGVDNTLKFVFNGGAIAADTGLKLQVNTANAADHAGSAGFLTAIGTAVGLVADATGTTQAELDVELAAAKAAALLVLSDAYAADITVESSALVTAINAVTTTGGDAVGSAKTAVDTVATAVDTYTIDDIADLVDFGVDGNGDYEWVLFKLTGAASVAQTLYFNDSDDDSAANVTTKFTKATIGAGDLTIGMTEAKDGTGANLAAPVAASQTLVTTADQFAVTATAVTDTIDVEQDRLFFSDATSDALSTSFVVDVTVDATIDLGLDKDTATFVTEVTGNMAGVDSISFLEAQTGDATDDDGAFDVDNQVAGDGINDQTIAVTVDGTTNLATRTLGVSVEITPSEADTTAFYLLGSGTAGANAFVWDLNGSEITFPYAPIGYDHITTNFEIANSGDQVGDVLITAFSREGVDYSGTLVGKAAAESLTKISETEVYDALALPAGTSLSITFSTTAPDADIKMTGYSNLNSGGRMTLLSDSYEGM